MYAACEIVTTGSRLNRTIRQFMSARDLKEAVLTLRPATHEGCLIHMFSQNLTAEIPLLAYGRWTKSIVVSAPRVLHIAKSYGDEKLTVFYLNERLYLNRTSIDATEISRGRRRKPGSRSTTQLELPGIMCADGLFGVRQQHVPDPGTGYRWRMSEVLARK